MHQIEIKGREKESMWLFSWHFPSSEPLFCIFIFFYFIFFKYGSFGLTRPWWMWAGLIHIACLMQITFSSPNFSSINYSYYMIGLDYLSIISLKPRKSGSFMHGIQPYFMIGTSASFFFLFGSLIVTSMSECIFFSPSNN